MNYYEKSVKEMHTMRSSSVVVIFKSIAEAPLKALEIDGTSAESKSESGTIGKSNSIKTQSCDFGTLLAIKTPNSVRNSILSAFTKPEVNRKCEAANVP